MKNCKSNAGDGEVIGKGAAEDSNSGGEEASSEEASPRSQLVDAERGQNCDFMQGGGTQRGKLNKYCG